MIDVTEENVTLVILMIKIGNSLSCFIDDTK